MTSPRFSPEAAKAGRVAMKERCLRVAEEETPVEVTEIHYRTQLTGRAWLMGGGGYHIEVPKPRTRKSLYIYLHEIGHVVLGHCDLTRSQYGKFPAWKREREAEDFAHDTMRKHGIAVPRSMTRRAHAYVARKKARGKKSAHRHKWVDFPEGYEQRGSWQRCASLPCTALRPKKREE